MKFYRGIFLLTFINFITLLLYCSMNGIAGSGSQTTNGVTVALSADTISINAGPGLKTMIISSNYNPLYLSGFFKERVTDDSGKSMFTGLDSGYYNVIVNNVSGDSAVLFAGLKISCEYQGAVFSDSLMKTGSISGCVHDSLNKESLTVVLTGTPYMSSVSSLGKYYLKNIPKGDYLLKPFTMDKIKGPDDGWSNPLQVKVEPGKDTKVSD